jgi:hypothetical protein
MKMNGNGYELDGAINVFKSEEHKYIKEARIFILPHISITDDEVLIEKVIKP